ncbi:hypothetical protein HPB52_005534 [Rhipicephalus sanguineus]|uniref:Uncharacterized protein n=1 Tax=Rhipicephalus sanguineus TaxID=34632 RepID=A0A9D4Q4E0_RHISA|nr:hypothetical protein HPB52_005534 [Rhipicephalus sanguineus]
MLRAPSRRIVPGVLHRRLPAVPAPDQPPGTALLPSVFLAVRHRGLVSAQWPHRQPSIQPPTPWPGHPGCPGSSSPDLHSTTHLLNSGAIPKSPSL